ncbi:multidrug effflux MFS transporter [Aquirufa novilacunae]|jgi:DHA1 family bicyclomycin/chloramphenicol resistance-like MFS transporter|uniref:Multidrug effflux MFS transporter n=1 Tax=Aquirufa novilacunae TaxID=3139305 RepID=A0ABW8U603_9BACT
MPTSANRTKIILILGILSAIGPLSIDMYLPAFKNIAFALNCSQEEMGYTLSSFFFGICLGQLISGPLLDHFGRKNVLYIGLSVYVLSSIACAFSPSVEMLVVFRLFQALGGSVGMVAPNAVIRETFEEHDRPKIMSLMILILGVSPILAPSLGSLLLTIANWKAIFLTLAGILLVIIFLIKSWLPEKTNREHGGAFRISTIIKAYKSLFKEKQYLVFAFTGAIGAGSIFTYVGGAPLTFLTYYGVNESKFGFIFAIVASGIISASQLNRVVLKKYSSLQILKVTLPTQLTLGLLLSILAKLDLLSMELNIALLFLIMGCQGFNFPNVATLALRPFHKGAGTASAMLGSIQMAWGAVCATLVGLFFDGTPFTMAIIIFGCAVLANTILFVVGKKYI